MIAPTSHGSVAVTPEISVLASTIPVPGLGALPVNAFVIRASEPVLIDSGVPALADATIEAIAECVDPADLRWIWVTHCDADHIGALSRILQLAPHARVVTCYLGMGKLGLAGLVPPERVFLINPGQTLTVGDRTLQALSMPSFDAPETMGVFDTTSRTLFSSDCFGAVLSETTALASYGDAAAIRSDELASGLGTWTSVDAPWLSRTEPGYLTSALATLQSLAPEHVLGAHLAPVHGQFDSLAGMLLAARDLPPFVGPDQAALEAMLGAAA